MDCRTALIMLDEDLDQRLPDAERSRLDRHLETCASCRQADNELERLMSSVEELPLELEPPRDLWPGIAAQLSERPQNRAVMPRQAPASRWVRQAMAALLWMTVGALLTQVFLSGSVREATPATDATVMASEPIDEGARLATLEAGYLRAKEGLWLGVLARRSQMAPETYAEVERNLLIIDQAIRDVRQALAQDPGNSELELLLLTQHRLEIDLLRRLTRTSLEA